MVCLNETISFEKKKLKNTLIDKLNESVKLNFELDINKDIIEKIMNNNKNKIEELFSSDYFIDITMNRNICSHKIKKGKMEGYLCCKKITINGSKKNYVCTKHNKDHIPKRKKNKKDNFINSPNYILNKSSKKIFKKEYIKNINFKNKKVFKNKFRRKNKIKIQVHGEINFNNIMKKLFQDIYT